MTSPKGRDPRKDYPADDDTTGHAWRSWRAGEHDHDDTTKQDNQDQNPDDDTTGHGRKLG